MEAGTYYEACKQKPGDGENPIEVLQRGKVKAFIYHHVKEMRRNNKADGMLYWMRVVTIKDSKVPKINS